LSFDRLKNIWEEMAKDYADKNSAYQDRLQTQSTKDSLASEISTFDDKLAVATLESIYKYPQGHAQAGEPVKITEQNFAQYQSQFASDVNINSPELPDLTDTLEHPREFLASNELSIIKEQRDQQLYQIPTIVQPGIPDDPATPNIDETTSPIVEFSTSDTPLNMWNDSLMFDLISKQGLLGTTPKKELSTLESQYGVVPESNLTDKSSIFSPSSLSSEPQEVNYMPDTHMLGFKANKFYKAPSDVLGNANSPESSPDAGDGTTWQWGEGTNAVTSRYSARGWNGGTATFGGDSYSFSTGLPISSDISWTNPETYYDSKLGSPNSPLIGITGDHPGPPWAAAEIFDDPETTTINEASPAIPGAFVVDGWPNTHATGFTLNIGPMSPSQFKNIPSVRTTRTWTPTTNYYDGVHTVNSIVDIFGGPVDFMTGANSYYPGVNSLTTGEGDDAVTTLLGIPGFTKDWTTGGYTFGEGNKGNSKFLKREIVDDVEIVSIFSTGTHTGYHDSGITFSDTWSFSNQIPEPTVSSNAWNIPTGFTYSSNTITPTATVDADGNPILDGDGNPVMADMMGGIYSGHPNPTVHFGTGGSISSDGTGGTKYLVDFMSGISGHAASTLISTLKISGFNEDFDPGSHGGYSEEKPQGDSKLLGLWDQEGYEKQVLTSMWTSYDVGTTGQTLSSITFDSTNTYSALSSLIPPDGTTWNIPTDFTYQDSIHKTNALSGTGNEVFGGPVNFMSGENSYFSTLSPEIPGFTKRFGISDIIDDTETDLPMGYLTADGQAGVSRFLRDDEGGFQIDLENYNPNTGTHTIKIPSWQMGVASNIIWPGPLGTFELYDGTGDSLFSGVPTSDGTESGIAVSTDVQWSQPIGFSYSDTSHTSRFHEDYSDADVNSWTFGRNVTFQNGDVFSGQTELSVNDLSFKTLYTDNFGITSHKFVGDIDDAGRRFDMTNNMWSVNPNRVYTGTTEHGLFKTAIGNNYSVTLGGTTYSVGGALDTGDGREPYVVSEIGNDETHWSADIFPLSRIQKDVQRIGKFLGSQQGEMFISTQNLLGTFQTYGGLYDPASTILNIVSPKEGLGLPILRFRRGTGVAGIIANALLPSAITYTEYLDNRAGSGGLDPTSIMNNIATLARMNEPEDSPLRRQTTYAEKDLKNKPLAFEVLDLGESALNIIGDMMGFNAGAKDPAGVDITSGIDSKKNMQISMGTNSPLGNLGKGDVMTLQGWEEVEEKELTGLAKFGQDVGNFITDTVSVGSQLLGHGALGPRDLDLETSKEGMPFYFKDLRDGVTIYFRAYLEGLSETISPSWNSENYIGRSEPVYTYTNSEREVNFTLKLFAQTKDELNMIYKKINRLTSLCYPEYKPQMEKINKGTDENPSEEEVTFWEKGRMKPPLTRFRLGELFGSVNNEMTGFIKSLSYSYPDESPWEIQQGKRVPKYITVDIGFQVIHSTVPSLDFAKLQQSSGEQEAFYGITKNMFDKQIASKQEDGTNIGLNFDPDGNPLTELKEGVQAIAQIFTGTQF